jgi:hypothetical protein
MMFVDYVLVCEIVKGRCSFCMYFLAHYTQATSINTYTHSYRSIDGEIFHLKSLKKKELIRVCWRNIIDQYSWREIERE